VVLARYVSPGLRDWTESKLENWLGCKSTGTKPGCWIWGQPGASLDFLGYTFRLDRDQYGRPRRYWNLVPSRKAVARERDALREMITHHQSHTPLPELIGRVNRNLRGWANYFGLGYPRQTFRGLNHFVR
jgi:RNA-directed DNA polymerase